VQSADLIGGLGEGGVSVTELQPHGFGSAADSNLGASLIMEYQGSSDRYLVKSSILVYSNQSGKDVIQKEKAKKLLI